MDDPTRGVLNELLGVALSARLSDPARSQEALKHLMGLLGTKCFAPLVRMLRATLPGRNTGTYEDVAQDGLIDFMQKIQDGRIRDVPEDTYNYLRTLVKWKAKDHSRRPKVPVNPTGAGSTGASPTGTHEEARSTPRSITEIRESIVDPQVSGAPTQMHLAEQSAQLDELLATISERDRQLVELHNGGMTFPELAERFGIHLNTAKKAYRNAYSRLLQRLAASHPTAARQVLKASVKQYGRPPAASADPVSQDRLNSAVSRLLPEVRLVATMLWVDRKNFRDVVAQVGHDRAVARRDSAYQKLYRELGPGVNEIMADHLPEWA